MATAYERDAEPIGVTALMVQIAWRSSFDLHCERRDVSHARDRHCRRARNTQIASMGAATITPRTSCETWRITRLTQA
jgi:hypothetical protein